MMLDDRVIPRMMTISRLVPFKRVTPSLNIVRIEC